MTKNLFKDVRMDEFHPEFKNAKKRLEPLYQRNNDLRSEFGRDYTRIIFSQAYRRLKHKTQVFFAILFNFQHRHTISLFPEAMPAARSPFQSIHIRKFAPFTQRKLARSSITGDEAPF